MPNGLLLTAPDVSIIIFGLMMNENSYFRYEQQCSPIMEKKCTTGTEAQCEVVNERKCETVEDEVCEDVPSKQCRVVNERKCSLVPKQECRVSLSHSIIIENY